MYEHADPVPEFLHARCPHRTQLHTQWTAVIADTATITPDGPVEWVRVGRAIELRIGLDLAHTPPYPQLLLALPHADLVRLLANTGYLQPTDTDDRNLPFALFELGRWRKSAAPASTPGTPLRLRGSQEPVTDAPSIRERQTLADCLLMAYVSNFDSARSGDPAPDPPHWFNPDRVAELRAQASAHDLQDLALLWQAYTDNGRAQLARLGPLRAIEPVFIRRMAIGDLVVGDTLVDVKTTTRPEDVDRLDNWVLQLLRYALLDHGDHYRLQRIGVYLTRQALLVTWPLEQLLPQLTGDPEITLHGLRTEVRNLLEAADPDNPYEGPVLTRWITRYPPGQAGIP